MFSLDLTCPSEQSEFISAELWEFGTVGIRELEELSTTRLIAGFETSESRDEMLHKFAAYSPCWEQEVDTDWVRATEESWPAIEVGSQFFVVPPWNQEPTPPGRIRLIQNPGLACGTGDHPCTQMALEALEACVNVESWVADVGSGSGILTVRAMLLGARLAVGVDTDEAAASTAWQNFELNDREPMLVAGSADCLLTKAFDVVVANISSTVVLAIFDDLLRIAKPGGTVILTGFSLGEARTFAPVLEHARIAELGDWACVVGHKGATDLNE